MNCKKITKSIYCIIIPYELLIFILPFIELIKWLYQVNVITRSFFIIIKLILFLCLCIIVIGIILFIITMFTILFVGMIEFMNKGCLFFSIFIDKND